MDDVRAVMDAAGSRRAASSASRRAAPMSILFAATYPERTRGARHCAAPSRNGSWARITRGRHRARRRARRDRGRRARSGGTSTLARESSPRASARASERRRAPTCGSSASPGAARRAPADEHGDRRARRAADDPRADAHAPAAWATATSTSTRRARSPRASRARASSSSRATRTCPGSARPSRFSARSRSSSTGVPADATCPTGVLATVLFTDIVGSTETAVPISATQHGASCSTRHHALVRRELARYPRHEVDTAGDGFFAAFDGPARAIRCACAIVEAVRTSSASRSAPALHTGECELVGREGRRDRRAHRRTRRSAGAGRVRCSSPQTVQDLVAGSGIGFERAGRAELKGVPGEWRLWSVSG